MQSVANLPSLAVGSNALMVLLASAIVLNLTIAAVALLRPKNAQKSQQMEKLCSIFVSRDRRQRIFILRHLVGLSNCLAGLLALNFGVSQGIVDADASAWLTYSALVVIVFITVLLRTGLNRYFSEPSLVTPHIVFAELFLAWGYYLGGPCRPVGLLLMIPVLLSNYFFTTQKVLSQTSLVALIAFGAVMARVAWEERFIPHGALIQLVYFCVMVVVLFSVSILAHHVTRLRSTSIKRKRELVAALSRIKELATRDELTGLFNRHHMHELLKMETSRCARMDRTFCIGLIDIDHFKRINDTHGHGIGDQVLVSFAAVLNTRLREVDAVARWGGEEFLVLLPDTDIKMAEVVVERILKATARSVVAESIPGLRVTFSAGLAQFKAGDGYSATIEQADLALYQAKSAGRNQIVLADPECLIARPLV